MTEEWYWNITRNRAERKEDAGPGAERLGPYPTEEAAKNWKATAEAREAAWKAQDDEWEGDGDDPSN